ncbi:MAG: mannitol dehydrogenase family protein [Cellvibrionaceae bacterium]|nr:mannitol dehydrogenase family protein [Cellvibrionaceae bacterium]
MQMRYIAHIGVGNFHRSHQAEYFQRLNKLSDDQQWGILGISLMPQDGPLVQGMQAQACRYHLVKRGPDGSESVDQIQVIKEIVPAYQDYERAIARLVDASTEIISFTITEGAYLYDQDADELDWQNADLLHDSENISGRPRTIFGYLHRALRQRRDAHGRGVTLMSCDNVQHNGRILQQALLQFLARTDADLSAWVAKEVCFPCTMVDRITPAFTPANQAYLQEKYNIDDAVPVVSEVFAQWVVEDNFRFERPALDKVDVIFTSNVSPFEDMKIKLLNGGHSCLAYLASLAGYKYVHEAIADERLYHFVKNYMALDARPCLESTPGIDLDHYIATLLSRFSNVAIADEVERLCGDGLSKLTNFLSPVSKAAIASGRELERLCSVYAGYALYLQRGVERGDAYRLFEPRAEAGELEKYSTSLASLLQRLGLGDEADGLLDTINAQMEKMHTDGVLETLTTECAGHV